MNDVRSILHRTGLVVLLVMSGVCGVSTRVQAADYPTSSSQLCSYVIGSNSKMRYCRNRALSSYNTSVTRAVIVIPGSGSDARDYYYNKILPYVPSGVLNYTNIIVPQFLEDDGQGQTVLQQLGLPNDYLYWSPGWRQCNSAKNLSGTSSCGMVDFIVEKLIEYNPNLEHIVVIGHSAGGQFVNRYVAASSADDYAYSHGVTMSYGISASGSFAYLNSQRRYTTSGCSGFNDWKWGLNQRNAYANDYPISTMVDRTLMRRVYYFVGANDTALYTDCKEKAQGTNHVDMMWKYKDHLKSVCTSIYGSWCSFFPIYSFQSLSGIGHNSTQLLSSAHAINIMYNW